jgi:hypothetical protein
VARRFLQPEGRTIICVRRTAEAKNGQQETAL